MRPLFKLYNVKPSPMAILIMTHKVRKYVACLVKHLTGNFGESDRETQSNNLNSIFNGKGLVKSIHLIDGIPVSIITNIGKETNFITIFEAQEGNNAK